MELTYCQKLDGDDQEAGDVKRGDG